jgi:hypothetical protein
MEAGKQPTVFSEQQEQSREEMLCTQSFRLLIAYAALAAVALILFQLQRGQAFWIDLLAVIAFVLLLAAFVVAVLAQWRAPQRDPSRGKIKIIGDDPAKRHWQRNNRRAGLIMASMIVLFAAAALMAVAAVAKLF